MIDQTVTYSEPAIVMHLMRYGVVKYYICRRQIAFSPYEEPCGLMQYLQRDGTWNGACGHENMYASEQAAYEHLQDTLKPRKKIVVDFDL